MKPVNPPNVLLVVMDTARASNVFKSSVMPTVEQITKEGVNFENAITTAPWTLPSHASLFTGKYTADHGTHAGSKLFDPQVTTMAEYLQAAGYQTVAVSNNSWISPEFGFDRGFEDFYVGIEPLPGGAELAEVARRENVKDQIKGVLNKLSLSNTFPTLVNALYARFLYKRYDDGALVANWQIKRWLQNKWNRNHPFFMFVNYLEPHLKYDPPRSYRYNHLPDNITKDEANSANQDAWKYVGGTVEMTDQEFAALKALYDGELSYLDYRLRKLYDFLTSESVLNDTILIITGDHGENIGEHGLMDHQYCLYETLLQVPLILRYPGVLPEGKSLSSLVELRDLYPTLMELTGAETPPSESVSDYGLPGLNISHSERDHAIAEYLVPQPSIKALAERAETDVETVEHFDRGLRCIRTEKWKYIEGTNDHEELFDLQTDRRESVNIVKDYPAVASNLRERLHTERGPLVKKNQDNGVQMNKKTQERLEDLGYI